MKFYELNLVVRPDLQQQDVFGIVDHCVAVLNQNGGVVHRKDYLGIRSLAYEIRNNKKGHYILMNIETTADIINELERNFRMSEDIIRYLTIATDTITVPPASSLGAEAESKEKNVEGDSNE